MTRPRSAEATKTASPGPEPTATEERNANGHAPINVVSFSHKGDLLKIKMEI
jgi:hypothetical protein